MVNKINDVSRCIRSWLNDGKYEIDNNNRANLQEQVERSNYMGKMISFVIIWIVPFIAIFDSPVLAGDTNITHISRDTSGAEVLTEEYVQIDGFHGYLWGTPKASIEEAEITQDWINETDYSLLEDKLTIYKDQNVAGYKCTTSYSFDAEGGLIVGVYTITEEHSNKTQYYRDYLDLVKKYEKIYGPRDEGGSGEIWYDDLYKNNPEDWGMAIITGGAKFISSWNDIKGDLIVLVLAGDNYQVQFGAFYYSVQYLENQTENMDGI